MNKEGIEFNPENVKFALRVLTEFDWVKIFNDLMLASNLKQALNEIREYIKDNVAVYAFNNPDLPHWEFNDDDIKQILQILDKVKE